uniref:Uncharacterized protein n=1 Tax=Heliothis virescens TaxID=7102 RepID=A0A2A4JMT2_HELVI
MSLPCMGTGFSLDKCKCKVLRTGYRDSDSVVLLAKSDSLCRLLDLRERTKTNLVVGLVENMYDSCAGYNLRYCPIRGFVKHNETYFSNTVKDLLILICFLLANFVVFLNIVMKTMVHIYFVVIMSAQWIRRSFLTKLDTNEEMVPPSPAQLYCYSPPIPNKYL